MIYQLVGNVLFLSLLEGLRALAGPLPGTHPGIWTCLLKHSIYLDHIGRVCSSTNRIHSLSRSLSAFSQRLMMSRKKSTGFSCSSHWKPMKKLRQKAGLLYIHGVGINYEHEPSFNQRLLATCTTLATITLSF